MHTRILLAVDASDPDEAASIAQEFSNEQAWSDWHEMGGRWSDILDGNILCFADDEDKFREVVAISVAATKAVRDEFLRQVGDLTIYELVTDPRLSFRIYDEVNEPDEEERGSTIDESLSLYRARALLGIVHEEMSQYQHFYDISSASPDPRWLEQRIKDNPARQFIIVWDYHH